MTWIPLRCGDYTNIATSLEAEAINQKPTIFLECAVSETEREF